MSLRDAAADVAGIAVFLAALIVLESCNVLPRASYWRKVEYAEQTA